MNAQPVSESSIFLSMLTILFIGLKLTGHIDWSWWWVLAPMWLPVVIVVPIVLVILAIAAKRR